MKQLSEQMYMKSFYTELGRDFVQELGKSQRP